MTKKKGEAKKPRLQFNRNGINVNLIGGEMPYIWIGYGDKYVTHLEPYQARRLAKVLLKFADWSEAKREP